MSRLQKKKAQLTVNLLLESACELSLTLEVSELSFKKVSEHAQISQRTMFRYFHTREQFLDAFSEKLHAELDLPDMPNSIESLTNYLSILYVKFDAQPRKVTLLLSSELLPRIISTFARERFEKIKNILHKSYPEVDDIEIMKTAANLRYIISASSWHYYRVHYDFDLNTSIDCAQMMLSQAIAHLRSQTN